MKVFQNEVKKAMELLEKKGYFTDGLWHINDVQNNSLVSKTQAQQVLNSVLNSEWIGEQINVMIQETELFSGVVKFEELPTNTDEKFVFVVVTNENEIDIIDINRGIVSIHHTGEYYLSTYFKNKLPTGVTKPEDLSLPLSESEQYLREWYQENITSDMIHDAIVWLDPLADPQDYIFVKAEYKEVGEYFKE